MRRERKKRLVFVSHAGEDKWVAQRIAEAVHRCGADAFLDESDIDIGEEFEERIHSALDKANEFIVLFTPWALKRTYVWTEIGAAWYRKIPIVVFLYGISIDEFRSLPNTPEFLKKRDMISLNDFATYIDELKRRIKPKKSR